MSLVIIADGRPSPVPASQPRYEEVAPVVPASPPSRQAYSRQAHGPQRTQRKPALQVADIMTSPVHTTREETTVTEVGKLMAARRIRHVPVTRHAETQDPPRLVGMISDRDILGASADQSHAMVKDIMARTVLTASPDTMLREAASAMLDRRVHSLPVLSGATLVGILTTTDILRALVHKAPLDLWA